MHWPWELLTMDHGPIVFRPLSRVFLVAIHGEKRMGGDLNYILTNWGPHPPSTSSSHQQIKTSYTPWISQYNPPLRTLFIIGLGWAHLGCFMGPGSTWFQAAAATSSRDPGMASGSMTARQIRSHLGQTTETNLDQ